MTIEYKAIGLSDLKTDEDTGIVEALVAVTGIVDEVKDIIEPGAFAKSLAAKTPKGVWSHDWDTPISRTEEIYELMPGDPRLPQQTKDGRPWPKAAGALYVKTRFNLDTQRGKEAFADVKFFGSDASWSIGYNVPVGGATVEAKSGIRRIRHMDLYEFSPVLHGAMPLAATVSVKSAQAALAAVNESLAAEEENDELEDGLLEEASLGFVKVQPGDRIEVKVGDQVAVLEVGEDAADIDISIIPFDDVVLDDVAPWVADLQAEIDRIDTLDESELESYEAPDFDAFTDEELAQELTADEAAAIYELMVAEGIEVTDDEMKALGVELETKAEGGLDKNRGGAEKLRAYWTRGEGAAKIKWGTPGDWRRCVSELTKYLGVRAKGYCNLRHKEVNGFYPGDDKNKSAYDGLELEVKAAVRRVRTAEGARAYNRPVGSVIAGGLSHDAAAGLRIERGGDDKYGVVNRDGRVVSSSTYDTFEMAKAERTRLGAVSGGTGPTASNGGGSEATGSGGSNSGGPRDGWKNGSEGSGGGTTGPDAAAGADMRKPNWSQVFGGAKTHAELMRILDQLEAEGVVDKAELARVRRLARATKSLEIDPFVDVELAGIFAANTLAATLDRELSVEEKSLVADQVKAIRSIAEAGGETATERLSLAEILLYEHDQLKAELES